MFVALGNTKPRLLSAAKQFTRTIAAKPEYLLKNIKYLKDEDVEWFQLICEKFKSSLMGHEVPSIKYEFLSGTDFQKEVWRATKDIEPGTTISYQQLANNLGKPKAVRAVGSALGKNNIAVIIPCHRIISSDGKLTGFRWGIQLKESLLEQEKSAR